MFLELAIAGDVDYIISNDFRSGMHNVKDISFKVISAKEFVETMGG